MFIGEIPEKCKDDITPKPKFGFEPAYFDTTERKTQTVNFKTFTQSRTTDSVKFDFAKGDRVSHAKFGEGIIVAVCGDFIDVAFGGDSPF